MPLQSAAEGAVEDGWQVAPRWARQQITPRFFPLLRAQHNLPDCFAAALAQARKATLVTSDKDFARVGPALKILWV